jgi:hypothetical protein
MVHLVERLATGWTDLRSKLSDDKISVPVQSDPGTYPASHIRDSGSFPAVKRPGHGVDQPPPPSTEVKEGVELNHYSPSGL